MLKAFIRPLVCVLCLLLSASANRKISPVVAKQGSVGRTNVEVTYAGFQPTLTGLDQANLILPRSLTGRGQVSVLLSADGKTTNSIEIQVR